MSRPRSNIRLYLSGALAVCLILAGLSVLLFIGRDSGSGQGTADRLATPNLHFNDGFVVLAINSQESIDTVTGFLGDHEFTFPVLLDPDGVVMSSYEIRGLPTSFFIDRDGIVRGVWSGQLSPSQLKKLADPLL